MHLFEIIEIGHLKIKSNKLRKYKELKWAKGVEQANQGVYSSVLHIRIKIDHGYANQVIEPDSPKFFNTDNFISSKIKAGYKSITIIKDGRI